MKKLFYFFIPMLCLWGCFKSPPPEYSNEIVPTISEIRENGKKQFVFLYNSDNRLIEIQKYFSDGINIWESWRYTYEGKKVVKSEHWSSHPLYLSSLPAPGKPLAQQSIIRYEYDSGQSRPVKELNYLPGNEKELRTYNLLSYDKEGNMIKNQTFTPDGKEINFYTMQYDNIGNIIKWSSSYWEYDTKANPLRLLSVPYQNPSWASRNNVTSNFGLDDKGNKTNIWRYEYTYANDTSYPLTMKTYVDNQLRSQSEFIYR